MEQKSYWTKRRKVMANVNKFFFEATNEKLKLCPEVATTNPISNAATSSMAAGLLGTVKTYLNNSALQQSHISDDSSVDVFHENVSCDGSDSDRAGDSSSSAELDDIGLAPMLADWALKFGINLDALRALQHLLHIFHPSLPLDPRTLLGTPTSVSNDIKEVKGGHYYHFGIASNIVKLHKAEVLVANVSSNEIKLQVNIDGLPVFRSTNFQLWPILGMVVGTDDKLSPFCIGLYGGHKKPSDVFEILKEFVDECKELENMGITLNGRQFAFKIHSIMCDAPARSFVRNTKGHTAYYGCDRCQQSGKWQNKMIFPEVAAPKRTDKHFRDKLNEDYHLGDCPLAPLSIDIVHQIPLDYMHLACLGVMRKIVLTWLRGPLSCRLPSRSVQEISRRLVSLRPFVPSEFCRRPRALSDIDRYKATEFRQILLYTGVLIFKDVVADEFYKHFLLFSVAMRCLCCSRLCCSHVDYANQLLVMFDEYGQKLYGEQFLVYNVHSLVHLSDDVKRFGPLDGISCFPYENYLRQLKKLIRSSYLPFQQVISRQLEMENVVKKCSKVCAILCKCEHDNGPLVDDYTECTQYSAVETPEFTLSLSDRDSCVLTEAGHVGLVKNILQCQKHVQLVLSLYKDVNSLFTYPLRSEEVDIFCVSEEQSTFVVLPLYNVRCKCVRLPVDEVSFVVMPLLHAM